MCVRSVLQCVRIVGLVVDVVVVSQQTGFVCVCVCLCVCVVSLLMAGGGGDVRTTGLMSELDSG